MPMAQAKTMAAQERSKFRYDVYVTMYCPRLEWGAPKYSPTTAPIVASVVATRRAMNRNGSADGMRTQRKTWALLAAQARISSIAAGSALVSPRTVLIMTGKKQMIAEIIALEICWSIPHQLFMIGAKAMMGIELAAIAKGRSDSRTITNRAVIVPARIPATEPRTSPATISHNVYDAAAHSSGR